MIDTDKYEGHSKGPWYWDGNLCNDEYSDKHGTEQWAVLDWELGVGDADKQLIADAPLLLQALIDERAEVKQLQVMNNILSDMAGEQLGRIKPPTELDNEELLAEVKRLREGIKRLLNEGSPDRIWVHNTDLRELIE